MYKPCHERRTGLRLGQEKSVISQDLALNKVNIRDTARALQLSAGDQLNIGAGRIIFTHKSCDQVQLAKDGQSLDPAVPHGDRSRKQRSSHAARLA